MILTDFFIRRSVRKLTRNSSVRPHHFCPLDKAKHILLLCEMHDLLTAEHCLQTLAQLGKTVIIVIHIPPDKYQDWKEREPFFAVRDKEHLSRWGFPSPEVSRSVTAFPADILIDLSNLDSYVIRYLMLQHPSTFKIGLKRPVDPDMYDFSITFDEDNTKKQLFDVILYYLRTIQAPCPTGESIKH
ncbi:MAG: hypothetical protein LBU03_06580 [Tannerellaceae bacterium]|jgi:hypothetical protein|nr:hypothetical protein [Tannerellaceae bacterium]